MTNIKSTISQATTDEEIGAFWDEHDLGEYWGDTHEVQFAVNLSPTVQSATEQNLLVRLEPDVAAAFPDAEAVNRTLRLLIRLAKQSANHAPAQR